MSVLNRRGLLRLIGGGVAAGATVDPKRVAKEVAAHSGLASLANESMEPQVGYGDGPVYDEAQVLLSSLYDYRDAISTAIHNMPPHISTKKSWSPAFKVSEARKEALEERRVITALQRNEALARKVARKLGFG